MENFYQESGRAGRDGLRAECILMYRYLDIFKITAMMFTEHTGLRNAYEMVEYAIDGFSCRRDLIAKHFLEVWDSSTECKTMCDRCFFKDSVQIPKTNITQYCLDLYKIIDRARSVDVKLTALKLLEAWYQKKHPNLRVDEVQVPKYERYYGEQMIAFLILKGFLKEDFHFSAYSTISYIRKGDHLATSSDRIIFYGARVLNLPELPPDTWHQPDDEECSFVSEIKHKKKKVKKEKRSKSREPSVSQDESIISASSSASKLKRRRLSSEAASLSSATFSESTPTSSKKKKHKRKIVSKVIEIEDDDCDIIIQEEPVIIKIED